MPFDATETRVTDPLTELGITPVPRHVLEKHMERVMRDRAIGTLAQWRMLRFSKHQLNPMLANAHATTQAYGVPGAWSAAPYRVRRLARRVAEAIPNATFAYGYFDADPFLAVEYQNSAGEQCRACLGIWWNRFRLIAIAQSG